MGIGIRLGLTGQRVNASPASLFTVSGSRGFMYDLSDYGSQWQDTGATVPITSTAQSVGLVLDQSQGLALGSELVTNGAFDAGISGWSDASSVGGSIAWNASLGALDIINATGVGRALQTQTVVVGRTYRLFVTNKGATSALLYIGSTAAGVEYFNGQSVPAGQSRSYLINATTTVFSIGIRNFSAGTTMTVDNISVRELAGNHATQATAGNRPLTTTIGAGFRGIQFDGVDDWLSTAAIDFSNSDEVTVVAGVRKLSDAAQAMLVELTTTSGATPQSFGLQAPGPATSYRFVSGGSATAAGLVDATGFAAPESAVISAIGDISGDRSTLRRNGAQVGQSTADQGTGNYANAIVYIGRRGGTSLPYNGVLTFLFAINRLLTANELAMVEAYANQRTGAY